MDKITKDNFSVVGGDPYPVYAKHFNILVDEVSDLSDDLDDTTSTADTNEADIRAIEASFTYATSASLTTAAAATEAIAITVAGTTATNKVLATIVGGTNTAGVPILLKAVCTTDTVTFSVYNGHAANALNGTLIIAYKMF